jgi:hypothetical protein
MTRPASRGKSVSKATLRLAVTRFLRDRTLKRWIVGWGGASILGIVNGAIRELAYKDRLGEQQANQLSALTLVSLLALYSGFLQRRWPLATTRDALSIGAIWGALTVIFEFGFGHYVNGDSWDELSEAYDVRKGNVWPLVLLSILAAPATARGIQMKLADTTTFGSSGRSLA